MSRDYLISVFEDTLDKIKKNYQYLEKEEIISKKQNLVLTPNKTNIYPKFIVTKNDCLVDAINYIKDGKVAVLNSASLFRAGGGVTTGASAQEESICRRTNLYDSLRKHHYPLHGKVKGIYHPNVTIFKNENFQNISPIKVDIMSLFSVKLDNLKDDKQVYQLYEEIFSTMFYFCEKNKIDTLIFVPIGCGVFRHPPRWVANYFYNYLEKNLLPVKKVVISCFTSTENYEIFREYFID